MYTLVSGSNCCDWNFNNEIGGERETLDLMGNDGNKVGDVEEGEISDTASVEEISEEDFKQEAKVSSKPKVESGAGRVWTMQDLYKYQLSRGFSGGSGLHNLAWAQAVQNKPLKEIFVMDVDADENSKRSSPSSSVVSVNSGRKIENVVIDDSGDEMDVKIVDVEKEKGELEEGEIDLDSEPAEKEFENENKMNVDDLGEEEVKSIRDELECVTAIEAEKSFERVCSQLQNSLEKLQKVSFGSNASSKESLIKLSINAIEVVNSVFCSMDHNLKEQNKCIYSRLLSFVKSNGPLIFSSDQMKEIEVLMTSLDSVDVLFSIETSDRDKATLISNGLDKKDSDKTNAGCDSSSTQKLPSDSVSEEPLVRNNPNMFSELLRSGSSNFRGRGLLVPLLDLHKDHDADSLPSPTREAPPSFPMHKTPYFGGDGIDKMESARPKLPNNSHNSVMHPYETDAVKAVSCYQQKFNRSSFNMFDRLPSPTPSEESGDVGGDVSGEVSSSSNVSSFKTVNPPTLGRTLSSQLDSFSRQGPVTAGDAAPVSSISNTTTKPIAKSRDPRLRFANSDAATLDLNQRPLVMGPNAAKLDNVVGNLSSRKQKTAEEPVMDGPALKRQKNGLESSGVMRDLKPSSGAGGWLEDTDTFGPQSIIRNQMIGKAGTDPRKMDKGITRSNSGIGSVNVATSGSEKVPVTSSSTTASLPALLKDIAVNPTMLLNLLKMGQQQRLAEEAQQKSFDPAKSYQPPSSNATLGAIPSVNAAPSNVFGFLQKPAEPPQIPSQIASANESGKIRMKPRDPRRVLHGNTVQRSGSLGAEQSNATNGMPTSNTQVVKDNLVAQKPEGQPDMKQIPQVSVAPPDITRQFTKNLKNIANLLSVSQAPTSTTPPPVTSQNPSVQPVQTNIDRVDAKPVVNSEDQQNGTGTTPDVAPAAPSSQNSWGDVNLLFEGYNAQQKAAIQRERARRIDEQKKMFSARKLCLVLDLDHTLLNSAKFGEVDPVHDEILRKKEEQDREKPQRHLFRFPHMGMWTKLRPGIWTFLERASKIFELHLYTMGNKLYATEMAKVLDPKGVLFAGRVISKGDEGEPFDGDDRVPKTKDLEGVLGMESAVLIIDDSIRVWPHNKLNLIVVERYTYFPCSRRQFGLPGPSLLEIDHDERPEDGTIASCLSVIERIHQIFFSHPSLEEVDVRAILASEQQKILANCHILFSRVIPVGEANPHLHPLWQTAEQFGAVCTNQIDEQVTHVVANSLGTDKVNWALSTGRFVVYPGWVEASALLYRRANEQDFSIKP